MVLEKTAKNSSIRAQLSIFAHNFSKVRTFRILHPSKRHSVLKVFTENKMLYFSKRALCAGTASNK